MNAVAPLGVIPGQVVFLLLDLIARETCVVLQNTKLRPEIRQDKKVLFPGRGRKRISSLFRQVDLVILFVDGIVELIINLMHSTRLIAQVFTLCMLNKLLMRGILKYLRQTGMFGQSTIGAKQENTGFLRLVLGDELLGIGNNLRDEVALCVHQPFYPRLHLIKPVVFTLDRTTDNQRCARLINQH